MNNRFILSPRHLLILALFAAAFLRFWQLDSLPPGLYHDEAYYALDALSLLEGKTFPIYYEGWELYAQDAHAQRPATPTRFPIFFEGNYGREPLHVYLLALSIKLFGATPFAIRLVVALSGVLAVWTTYLAAGALFGERELVGTGRNSRELSPKPSKLKTQNSKLETQSYLPALAAFALAILYPALTFSRFGIRAMHFVPIETLAVYCFWRGISAGMGGRGDAARGRQSEGVIGRWYAPETWNLKPQTLWFIGAGFFLGLGLYSYAAARLLPLLFVVFVPLWFWWDREPSGATGGR
ncbi:MAG: glycosyltransferase family 39 protein [Chloroflexi bacterium]|nr:glycosyltransferase family 39 protein [Chloroflexota bacterium]